MVRFAAGRTVLTAGIALVGCALLGSAIMIAQPRALIELLARTSPEVLYYVDTSKRRVALTIDDGPDLATTPVILDVLARNDAHATFFLIGSRARANRDLVSRIVGAGHELGNHMMHDRASITLDSAEFTESLERTDAILSRFDTVRWTRPGSGWYDETMLATIRRAGYRAVLGSVYPYDAALPFPAFAAAHILSHVRPGAIIVLHDGGDRGARTAEVLRRVLPELDRRGYRVVTLSDIVDAPDG